MGTFAPDRNWPRDCRQTCPLIHYPNGQSGTSPAAEAENAKVCDEGPAALGRPC